MHNEPSLNPFQSGSEHSGQSEKRFYVDTVDGSPPESGGFDDRVHGISNFRGMSDVPHVTGLPSRTS